MRRVVIRGVCLVACVAALVLWSEKPAKTVSGVTLDSGIALTFQDDETCGTFANGDQWCVGPVSITAVSPAWDGSRNGCELNFTTLPTFTGNLSQHWNQAGTTWQRKSGFRTGIQNGNYDAAVNVCDSLPLVVAAGNTVMLSKGATCNGLVDCIDVIEPFTVLAAPAAAGDFRPPYAGTDKTIPGNKSEIRYSVLTDINPASITGEQTLANANQMLRYPIFQTTYAWSNWQNLMPRQNRGGYYNGSWPGYGRNIDIALADVVMQLFLNHSDANKETIAIRVVQQAIDIAGLVTNGFHYINQAGFRWSAKELMMIGASLLNDGDMMALANPVTHPLTWDNDQQFFYVRQIDVNTPRTFACGDNASSDPAQCLPYTQPMVDNHRADWCAHYFVDPADCSARHNEDYAVHIVYASPLVYFLKLMMLQEEYGNDAPFDYIFDGNTASGPAGYFYTFIRDTAYTGWGTCDRAAGATYAPSGYPTWFCNLVDLNTTPIDGSVSTGPVVTPTVTVSAPANLTETTSATITFSGTAASSAGIASVNMLNNAAGQSAEAATGTTSWTGSRSLTANSVNVLTAQAIGSDGGNGLSGAVSVLRMTSPSTTTFDFSLAAGAGTEASWPNLPTTIFVDQGTNNVILWKNNRAEATGVNGRHFSFWNPTHTDFGEDQYAQVALGSPTNFSTDFVAAVVQAQGTTSTTYDNCHCTAQGGETYCAQIVNGTRTQLGTAITVSPAWQIGDIIRVELTDSTNTLEVFKNNVSIGTRTSCTLTGGQPGLEVWGTGIADDFAAGNLAMGDQDSPLVAFVAPTSDPTYTTSQGATTVNISGTASDATDVTACTYLNVLNGATAATTGEESWSAVVAVVVGQNDISVSCTDGIVDNPPGVANLTVTVPDPNPEETTITRYRLRIR